MTESLDRRFMAAAIRLGACANGSTWPNPAVGAVVVKDGSVVGRGRTAPGGRPHGEAMALAAAGEAARGATVYVSLEPCAHQGRAGPCADAIIAAGVARVVAAIADPDPRVHGKGFARLRNAGIEVMCGLMVEEARRAHAGHLCRVESGRPYVLLKLAVSADDAIGRVGEAQVHVSGEIARRRTQALRTRFDAILVGRGTVEVDDPALTVRLPGLERRSPLRVILDSAENLMANRQVLSGMVPTWVLGSERPDKDNVRWFGVPRSPQGADFPACLRLLAERGIARLLVEGGAKVARGFIEADLVDEVLVFRSPRALGGDLVPALAGLPLSHVEHSKAFRRIEQQRFGADMMSRYIRAH
jgi:diaminohydroxyphosphoribosylaminopyrimidine deaminase/5-amino-6-(5-phosphoribosylamino)uracil reductase